MFEKDLPEQGDVFSCGLSQRDGARGSAGTVVPDSDRREHIPAAEVFKHALKLRIIKLHGKCSYEIGFAGRSMPYDEACTEREDGQKYGADNGVDAGGENVLALAHILLFSSNNFLHGTHNM